MRGDSIIRVTMNEPDINRTLRRMAHMGHKGKEEARKLIAGAALDTETGAKIRVPVDTGRLKNSIHAEFSPDELEAKVGTNVKYAIFVEEGTIKKAGRPFLTPAAEVAVRRMRQDMKSMKL